MAYDKIILLLKSIQQRTKQGKLAWTETNKTDMYQVAFPQNSVRISMRRHDEAEEPVYVFGIYNDGGTLIEEITHQDIVQEMGGGRESFKFLKDLFEAARRKAMGVDQAIDNILSELNTGNLPF